MDISIMDVIGPVMIGPSSSHTAGAARLGGAARALCGKTFNRAEFGLHGSFAKTYRGHGTDLALLAGIIGMSPEDGRIPIDFRMPAEPWYEDSTAAAIAACGMLEIAREVPELEKRVYTEGALRLLRPLVADRCDWDTLTDGILQKCSSSYSEPEHEYNIIYGDYYLVEALLKLTNKDLWIW